METAEYIPVEEICLHHKVELSFIISLGESGLIEITSIEEKICLPASQLPELEKMMRLYYEMDINVEGIETITYLLEHMRQMQQEIMELHNRLQLFEAPLV